MIEFLGKEQVKNLAFQSFYKAKEENCSGGFAHCSQSSALLWTSYGAQHAPKFPTELDMPKACSKTFVHQFFSWIVFQTLISTLAV